MNKENSKEMAQLLKDKQNITSFDYSNNTICHIVEFLPESLKDHKNFKTLILNGKITSNYFNGL